MEKTSSFISGKIVRLFYSSPDFCAGVLKSSEHGMVKFAGKVVVDVDDQVKLIGSWKKHPKYGDQFNASSLQHDMDLDADGLAHYLTTNPAFKGIGPVKAEKIAAYFGEDFDRVLRTDPGLIKRIGRLSDKDIEVLQVEWEARKEFNFLSTWLGKYELTHNQITKLVEKFGHNLKPILEKDPYIISREVEGFGFFRTDQIAQKLGIPPDHPGRIQAATLYIISQRIDSGHCWSEKGDLIDAVSEILALDNPNFKELIEEQLNDLISKEDIKLSFHDERALIADTVLYEREMRLADMFIESRNNPPKLFAGSKAARILGVVVPNLNSGQQEAVRMAFTSRISLMSGAAGSGKSYTIAAITRICKHQKLKVALAAPTGKAAKRMEELSSNEAKTIHRLLGYNGFKWKHDAENLLNYDMIILDEVSMMDINLAWRFFNAVDLTRTQVVLVGDHNQLPSVGAGNILHDLIDRRLVPMVILDQVVRQAGILKENCAAILDGKVEPTVKAEKGFGSPWYVINDTESEESIIETLLRIVEQNLALEEPDALKNIQILTPTKKGPLGASNLNIELQRLVQRLKFAVTVEPVSGEERPPFYQGDKVMQIKNNYNSGIMNGNLGFIRDIRMEEDEKGKPCEVMEIDFDGHSVVIPTNSKEKNDLQLAYACTIHKYQGSEVGCALTIVHNSHYFMLHRNLLYTAVTRSREISILLGNKKGIKWAVSRQTVEKRRTFLSLINTQKIQ